MAAASSLSRMAVSWRPNQLRRTTPTSDGEHDEHDRAPHGEGGVGRRSRCRGRSGRPTRQAAEPEDARVAEDDLAADERDAERAEREVQAAQAHRRAARRATPSDRGDQRRRASMPSTLSPPKVLPVTNAPTPTNRYCVSETWPDSPVSATSDRAMVRDHERPDDVGLEVVGPDVDQRAPTPPTSTAPATQRRAQRRAPRGWSRPTTRPADRRNDGTSSTASDEEEAGDGEADPEEHVAVGPQPGDVGELLAQPEEQRADEGHRQAGEPADHRRAVGVEHEQREHDGVEVLRRRRTARRRARPGTKPIIQLQPGDDDRAARR